MNVATTTGALTQEIARLNPWWRDPDWAAKDLDLRDAANTGLNYRSPALDELDDGSLYMLRGPRRAGKTVCLTQQIVARLDQGALPTSIVRLAVDGWGAKELRTVVQNVPLPPIPRGTRRTWLIDEVSAVAGDWATQIKWLRDNDAGFRDATVVLTGSNASALTTAAGTLAGRRGGAANVDRVLMPLGFRSFAHLVSAIDAGVQHPSVSDLRSPQAKERYQALIPWLDELVRAWETYLQCGGFPRSAAAAARGEPIPPDFVEDMFNVISRDAFANSSLSAPTEMAFLERLWNAMASPANESKIGADVDISQETVARHVGYLRDAFLLWRCPRKADGGWLPRDRAQAKLYAVDPVVARLAHLRNPQRADIDPTVLNEMQIGMALRRRLLAETPAALNDDSLFYLRTPARKEIDFVSDHLAGVAVEGKYVEDSRWASEAATVDASEWAGILATRNVLDIGPNSAWAVPAAFLAYLVDT